MYIGLRCTGPKGVGSSVDMLSSGNKNINTVLQLITYTKVLSKITSFSEIIPHDLGRGTVREVSR